MGVPGMIMWILKKYKSSILLSHLPSKPKYLYIDANSLFHPICAEHETESQMFSAIITYINNLYILTNPDFMFIAVDGVAPVAKIVQQRLRRYKSYYENQIKNKLKDEYNIPYNKSWSSLLITPGTEFMEKLHNVLLSHYSDKPNIYYSSYHEFGEGEHKILQHIKQNSLELDNIVIYGLDADLIFLALVNKCSNIFLLRDNILEHKGFVYMSISVVKHFYLTELTKLIKYTNLDHTKLIQDFIFICFLLGNDFLPHLPSINIYNGGLDKIINVYTECFNILNEYLINNKQFLLMLFQKLSVNEFNIITTPIINTKKPQNLDDYNTKLFEFDNLKHIQQINIYKDITNFSDFKNIYYSHYFSFNNPSFISMTCQKYIEGLFWISEYYFDKCHDYKWYYLFNHAPLLSDICTWLESNTLNFKFIDNPPLTYVQQLLIVIPPQVNHILPTKYQHLNSNKKISYMFPFTFEFDYINKLFLWQCQPILPILNLQKIIDITSKIK